MTVLLGPTLYCSNMTTTSITAWGTHTLVHAIELEIVDGPAPRIVVLVPVSPRQVVITTVILMVFITTIILMVFITTVTTR
jgi:hypothetical protein